MGSDRKASAPARWHPYAVPLAAARTGDDEGSPRASPPGEARRSMTDMVPPPPPPPERNLLSLFKGDARPQSRSARPAPSLALSLRVGSEEEEAQINRPVSATIRRLSSGQGRVPLPQQPVPPAAAPSPSPPLWPLSAPRRATSIGPLDLLRASAGGAPPRMRAPPVGVGLRHLAAGATPPTGQQRCDMYSFYHGHLEVATAEVRRLRNMNLNLHRQAMSFREELRMVRQLQQAAAAAGDAAEPSSLMCPACWLRPATVVLLPHAHLCLCRRCSAARRGGDPSIACPRCAVARAGAVEAAPR